MTTRVECAGCGRGSNTMGWGFTLMAREGWTLDDQEERAPSWRCTDCARDIEKARSQSRPGSLLSNPKLSSRRLRVLLVDDEELVLRATARFLMEFELSRATSGKQALALLEASRDYDVVVSDVSMPHMSGPDLFCVVSQRWSALARRFVFVSGNVFRARPLILAAAQRAKVPSEPALLEKPLDAVALRDQVLTAAARRVPQSGAYPIAAQRVERKTRGPSSK